MHAPFRVSPRFVAPICAILLVAVVPGWTADLVWDADAGSQVCRLQSLADYPGLQGDRHFAPDRTVDVLHQALHVDVDLEEGRIEGTVVVVAAPLHDGFAKLQLNAVELDILGVREVSVPDPVHADLADEGVALDYSHVEGSLEIGMGTARAAGDVFAVAVDYAGSPRRGLFFVRPSDADPNRLREAWTQGEAEDSRYWFPSHDHPNDQATSSVTATVDGRYTVVSNGALLGVERAKRSSLKTWRWYESRPHVTYLTSLAIGEFDEAHETWRDIPVDYYVPRGMGDWIDLNFHTTLPGLDFFSDFIGVPYPYEKYAQVSVTDFMFGGMENISATTLTRSALRDPVADMESDIDGLVAHELAHQWWGDMITCRDWSHIWLNEGFATYFTALCAEALEGDDKFRQVAMGALDGYLRGGYHRAIVERRFRVPMDLFDHHAYAKGGRVLHLLRYELGDELFRAGIAEYAQAHAWTTVTTADLQESLERATGRSLARFFEDWVYGPGHPEITSSWRWDGDHGLVRLEISQSQVAEGGIDAYDLPVEIALVFEDGRVETERHRLSTSSSEWLLPAAERPASVIVDPDGWLLANVKEEGSAEELARRLGLLGEDEGHYLTARIRTVRALGKTGPDPKTVEALAAALEGDPWHGVRSAAASALGAIGGREVKDALLAGLSDTDARVRNAVAGALAHVRNDEDVHRALAMTLRKDEAYGPRAAAVRSLTKLGADDAEDACQRALKMDSYREGIRRAALDGLMELDLDDEAARHARRLLNTSGSSWLRSHSVGILGRVGSRLDREDDRRERKKIRLILEQSLESENYFEKRAAVDALRDLRDPASLPAVRRVARHGGDSRLEQRAQDALGPIRAGGGGEDELDELAGQVEDLESAREELEERLDALERTLDALGAKDAAGDGGEEEAGSTGQENGDGT